MVLERMPWEVGLGLQVLASVHVGGVDSRGPRAVASTCNQVGWPPVCSLEAAASRRPKSSPTSAPTRLLDANLP